ncbi:MAG: hypothetical protein LIP23_02285 [Planctomycetes bacterium]|nr:hypothetical protein [Planctomycetota bacterium]
MKLMRLAMCVAVFALVGGIAMAEDLDVQALQARLAAQEARLNDLQAKVGGGSSSAYAFAASAGSCDFTEIPEGILSIEKNAVVTLGGTVNTRYFYRHGKVEAGGDTLTTAKIGDLRIADAKVRLQIDVNDNFDAFLQMDLQDSDFDRAGIAEKYWVRWKNICNSGFGVLVGRNDLVFGDGGYGVITGWTGGNGAFGDLPGGFDFQQARLGWDHSRTTQITPYWESQDGKFKGELSFFQSIDGINGNSTVAFRDGEYRAINYGVGSMALRLTAAPIEGLKLTAGIINIRSDFDGAGWTADGPKANSPYGLGGALWPETAPDVFVSADGRAKNNTAMNLAFRYRPCFLPRLNTWAQWIWNFNDAGWWDGYKTHTVNAGFSVDFTEQFGWFLQGDFLSGRNKDAGDYKEKGYAVYTGFTYNLPYGVNAEIGYRYERIKFTNGLIDKQISNTAYAHLGFNF